MQERTDKIYQRNHSLLTSLKYAVLSLCKILADNIKTQMAFDVLIRSRVLNSIIPFGQLINHPSFKRFL